MQEGRACLPGAVWRMTGFRAGSHVPRKQSPLRPVCTNLKESMRVISVKGLLQDGVVRTHLAARMVS
jgi:hypothetical protein